MRTWFVILAFAIGVFVSACGGNSSSPVKPSGNEGETYEEEIIDIKPAQSAIDLLADDKLSDKKPVFDAALADSRPIGHRGNQWQLNASSAVIGLDIEDVGDESGFDVLYPDYAKAAKAFSTRNVLPSVNMIDAKAKQFDDGLYAALDLWQTQNTLEWVHDTHELCKELLNALDSKGEAYAWISAAMLCGGHLSAEDATRAPERAKALRNEFERDETKSKPVGFYTWNDQLQRCFKFLRFLQQGFKERDRRTADALATAIKENTELRKQYERTLSFYAELTNPFSALNLVHLIDNEGNSLRSLWSAYRLRGSPNEPTVHFLPYSISRETELFNRLFPEGLPNDADLMLEFVRAIRSGKVDLKPRANSGWYDYQVYALETFLLSERGRENNKLLLTKKYKQRMLEAFKALVTKRRETHVRQLDAARDGGKADGPPPEAFPPHLRVEPNPTFYLRTARAYNFLHSVIFFHAMLDDPMNRHGVWDLKGKREGGERQASLEMELEWMRDFFYGLHLISCEDIGMKDELLEGEVADRGKCFRTANSWTQEWYSDYGVGDPSSHPSKRMLAEWNSDADLAVDTRVAVPVFFNRDTAGTVQNVGCWGTLGVRPVKLRAWYATSPKWRPIDEKGAGKGEWQDVWERQITTDAHYIILTDEFGEFTLKGNRVLNRAEFRDFCDRGKTKRDILSALNR